MLSSPSLRRRGVDHEGEVLEVFVTKKHDRKAAMAFVKRTMKRYGHPRSIVTDRATLVNDAGWADAALS